MASTSNFKLYIKGANYPGLAFSSVYSINTSITQNVGGNGVELETGYNASVGRVPTGLRLLPFGVQINIPTSESTSFIPLDVRGATHSTNLDVIQVKDGLLNPLLYVSYGGNVGIGTSSATARLQVKGSDSSSGVYSVKIDNSLNNPLLYVKNDGNVSIGLTNSTAKLHIKAVGTSSGTYSLKIDDSSNNPLLYVNDSGSIGIGLTNSTAKLHIKGNTSSTLFKVDGTSGELFSIVDSLVGSLFSVNDISGLPILEVFSDNSILFGSYQAPALTTTTKIITTQSQTDIYSIATASYSGAVFEYTIASASNTRAGIINAVWLNGSVQYTDTKTADIGSTTGFTFSVVLSATQSILRANASSNGWTVKTIIRTI